jgi:hypothetical protein
LFASIHENPFEYLFDYCPNPKSIHNVDILSFRERTWCNTLPELPFKAKVCHDNVAIAEFDSYEDWLQQLPKETKMRLLKSKTKGLSVTVVNPHAPASPFNDTKIGEALAEGMRNIYNETPLRQYRRFKHYGISLQEVRQHVFTTNNTLIGAYLWTEEKQNTEVYLKHKLVGFIELSCGDNTGAFKQILSLTSYRDTMPNNALIAKAVEVCASRGLNWLVYGRMGNHPSLDEFKKNNSFKKVIIKRFFVPLTLRGKIFLFFNLQRSIQDKVPSCLKPLGFHAYNFFSRLRT